MKTLMALRLARRHDGHGAFPHSRAPAFRVAAVAGARAATSAKKSTPTANTMNAKRPAPAADV